VTSENKRNIYSDYFYLVECAKNHRDIGGMVAYSVADVLNAFKNGDVELHCRECVRNSPETSSLMLVKGVIPLLTDITLQALLTVGYPDWLHCINSSPARLSLEQLQIIQLVLNPDRIQTN
jgi:phage gp37-like protein